MTTKIIRQRLTEKLIKSLTAQYNSAEVQCTGWQPDWQNKCWQPISYKVCQ